MKSKDRVGGEPAKAADGDEELRNGFNAECAAILKQCRRPRAQWLEDGPDEFAATPAGIKGMHRRVAAAAYLDVLPYEGVAMLPALRSDGSCSCVQGRLCLRPGEHPRRNEDGEVLKGLFVVDIGLMGWEFGDPDVAIEMGKYSGFLALTIEVGGWVTAAGLAAQYEGLPKTLTATLRSGGKLHLFRRPRVEVVPSFSPGTGLWLAGDGDFLRVPPGFEPSDVPVDWDTPTGGPTGSIAKLPDWLLRLATDRDSKDSL